jgi:hypothetical protein
MYSQQEVDTWLQVAKENMVAILINANYKIQQEFNVVDAGR